MLLICQIYWIKKNWVVKITKLFVYKIYILILLKKSFASDKHVDDYLIEKQTQKICRRTYHNNLILLSFKFFNFFANKSTMTCSQNLSSRV